MIRQIIHFGFEQRWAVFLVWIVAAAAGVHAFRSLPIEPFPDPDDVHVTVVKLVLDLCKSRSKKAKKGCHSLIFTPSKALWSRPMKTECTIFPT